MPRGTSEHAGLRLQPRCLEILSMLGHVSALDTRTIHERWWPGKSLEACRSKLRLYNKHGLTQTLHLQIASTSRSGRLPIIHRLTERGADLVEDLTGHRPPRTAKSAPPSPHTLLHRVGMARLVITIDDACQLHNLPKPGWLLEYDPEPNAKPGGTFAQRFRLRFDIRTEVSTESCWPDAACRLTIPHNDALWNLALLFEYDRGTETLNQVARKMTGYTALLNSQAYQQLWPDVQGVRIFFVIPSHRRREHIAAVIRDSPAASVVRLASEEDLSADRILADPVWYTVSNETRPVLKSPN